MKNVKILLVGFLTTLSLSVFSMHHELGPEAVAEAWITAGYTGKNEAINMVTTHLAEDGVRSAPRYVGFGFEFDPDAKKGEMTVTRVVPDSPASKVLQVGDQFLQVKGVRVNERNMDKLPFRGKPGEPVKARIKRDGKMLNIEVARGIIAGSYSKTEILENMTNADADDWAPEEFNIEEVLSKGNIVYVLHSAKNTEESSGLPFSSFTVTRFMFNEDGKVSWVGRLTEDRFVLEQLGYSITR
jgi:hypothetical protein